jgi:hypothetical protein
MTDRKRAVKVCLGIFLIYALLTLVMTWPVVARLGTDLVGDGDDMWVHYWNGWWVKRVLTKGGDVYSTDLLFHPQVVNLVYHNFGWVNIAGWLVIEPFIGGIAAFNLVYLINVTLCAFAMFVLARHLLKSDGSAFIAGLVYGYWPYRLSDYDHPNMISTEWLPLTLLCIILLVRRRGEVRYALLGGGLLALTGLSRWQMLLPTSIAIGIYLLFSMLFEREYWSWRLVGMLGLVPLVVALLVAVPFYPLAHDLITGVASERLYLGEEVEKQTDLLAYFVPPIHHPLAPLFDGLRYVHSPMRFSFSAFVGYSVFAIVVLAVIRCWQVARLWAVLALAAFLLALGPVLRLNYHFYPAVPMPYRLVGWLAPVRWLRYPHRFNTLLALPVAMLVGYGAFALRERLVRRRAVLLWGILSALILFEYFNVPLATIQATAPVFYQMIAQEDRDFAVLDLPLGRDKGDYYMFYQTVHGRPIVEGNTARPQPYMFDFIDSSPLLHALREEESAERYPDDTSRQLAVLADAGIHYVVMHKQFVDLDQLGDWLDFFFVNPVYKDDTVLVYPTALEYRRDFDFETALGDNIGLIGSALSATALPQDGLLEVDLRWGTRAAPTHDWVARLALVSPTGGEAQAVDVEPCVGWPTLEWGANAVARGRAALQIDPFIEAGRYNVTLGLVDLAGRASGQPVTLGQVEVQAVPREFDIPGMDVPVEATFGDALRLLGYDLHQESDALTLTLHWQAQSRMDVTYKIFVHLVDSESGELVAQADVVPRNWGYPTTWWEVGEVVSDEIEISLTEVKPGTYHLMVGVYDPISLRRLSTDEEDDRIPLEEIEVSR